MAGPTREEERNSLKKLNERRDFSTKRKNSFGKNKELNTSTPSFPTTVSSPTTPTSVGSTASNNSYASGPALRPTPEHIPINSFNAQEVIAYLNDGYNEVNSRFHDNNIPSPDKPEIYRPPQEKAWGRQSGGPAWGQKAHLMANASDFFTELRKSTQVANAQPATSK